MADTWFPLYLTAPESVDGDEADIAVPDFANARVAQLTSFWRNAGNTAYDDVIFLDSYTTGLLSTSAFASAICGVSHNHAFDGANGGRAARLGTDGYLYVTTASNAAFTFNHWGLSKINLSTLTETAFVIPSVVTAGDLPQMVAFKIGATNYVALFATGGTNRHVEVLNVDTMATAGNHLFADGGSDLGGVVLGAHPDANSVEFFILHTGASWSVQLERVVFSTISGLSTSTIASYLPWQIDYRMTNASPDLTDVAFDPNDGGIIFHLHDFSGPVGGKCYLLKISGTARSIVWQSAQPDAVSIDTWNKVPPSDVSNGRLLWVVQDGSGDYQFINTANGYTASGNSALHLVDLDNSRPIWDGPNNRLVALDGGDNDFIDTGAEWYNGWAVFFTDWVTPTVPPVGAPIPSTFDITVVRRSGTTIIVPDPPFPGMTLSTVFAAALGGGQAGTQGDVVAPGIGGEGADYASLSPVLAVGQVLDIHVAAGGATAGAGGEDSWLKDIGGTIILQARGATSGSANIGAFSRPGGTRIIRATWSNDGSYGNVNISGFGGTGGASSGGPDDFPSAGYSGIGSRAGDTCFAVGQIGGTGGGAPCTDQNPPWDAPGQAWITAGGSALDCGAGGGLIGPPFGISGQRGQNNPLGTNDGLAGGGGSAGNTLVPSWGNGGNGDHLDQFTDTFTFETCGPGGGAGGGSASWKATNSGQTKGGDGGRGGDGGGGGGSGGVGGPPGAASLGNPAVFWQTYTGTLPNPGAGGQGWVALVATFIAAPPDSPPGPTATTEDLPPAVSPPSGSGVRLTRERLAIEVENEVQRWLIRTGHIRKWGAINVDDLRLTLKRGVGTNDVEPSIWVRANRDNKGFGRWVKRGLGLQGDRVMVLNFGGFGSALDWQFEVATSDACEIELRKMEIWPTQLGH